MSSSVLQQPASVAAPSTPLAAPPTGRLDVLDVLRGIALLGMYVVHFNDYATSALEGSPAAASAPVRVLESTISLFFDGRFYTMFGMLFGIGFALQLRRADARGERFTARFVRRLAALAVFGAIAEGVFGYNVLFGYALWGLPLLLIRRWPIRALVVLAVLCAASRPIYNVGRFAIVGRDRFVAETQAKATAFRAASARRDTETESRDFRTVVAARARFMPIFHRQWSVLPWGSFTLFVVGLIWFRLGLFDQPEQHRRLIVALMVAGAASWAIEDWGLPFGAPIPQPLPKDISTLGFLTAIARTNGLMLFRDAWLAFTYIGAVLLLVAHDRSWLRRLASLGWAGRMALTNYMTQVIVLDVLFSKYGFGLTVTPFVGPLCAVTLFAAHALFSRWWLTRYRLGPLEWVWRSVTYWKLQPQRIAAPVAGAVATA